jgi:hypothetical protein
VPGGTKIVTDDLFTGRLLGGERVVWSGQPGRGLIFMPRDVFLVPFSLLWCGFAIFWTVSAGEIGSPGFFTLWGAMFICIGLYFVVGRFVLDAWIRRRVQYAVTNRRILIARGGPFSNFTALSLGQLPDAQLSERGNGRGTIRFGQAVSMWSNQGMSTWTPSLDPTPQLLAIDDARSVFDLIQRSRA